MPMARRGGYAVSRTTGGQNEWFLLFVTFCLPFLSFYTSLYLLIPFYTFLYLLIPFYTFLYLCIYFFFYFFKVFFLISSNLLLGLLLVRAVGPEPAKIPSAVLFLAPPAGPGHPSHPSRVSLNIKNVYNEYWPLVCPCEQPFCTVYWAVSERNSYFFQKERNLALWSLVNQ